jgi:hypothetical protein
MKAKMFCVLLSFLLLANAKARAGTNELESSGQRKPMIVGLPFMAMPVDTAESATCRAITNKVLSLLAAKEYDQLDEFAAKLRSSKECMADGTWKLAFVYCPLPPSNKSAGSEWEARLTSLRDWCTARSNSVTARVALACVLTDYAWQARGGGWANSVSDEGWRMFFQRLREADEILDQTGDRSCPFYWSVRMRVALGLQKTKAEFDAIFSQALSSIPDYKPYYFWRAFYLLPRWNGEPGEWENDLAKSADRIGGEEGDAIYAQVVWSIHQSVNFGNVFDENHLSWPRVDKGFEVILKRFPDSLAAKNERAHLAVLADDPIKARRYFDQTTGKIDLCVWKSATEYMQFAFWAYRIATPPPVKTSANTD